VTASLFQILFGAPEPPPIAKPRIAKPKKAPRDAAAPSVRDIFEHEYRALRPRAPQPPLDIRFKRFTSLNTTIRLREGQLHVRLSDILETAPPDVLSAIAHILIAKLYRKDIDPARASRYRRYTTSETIARQAEHVRQTRGRKRISTAQGEFYDLDEVFETLNARFFHGMMGRPTLTWSSQQARRMLGHYDAAHNTIVVSKVFDRADTPRAAVEYLLYHEMLHLKHPVKVKGGRRCVHSREFQAEEKLFPDLVEAKAYLKRL